jgi:hypothetical protein
MFVLFVRIASVCRLIHFSVVQDGRPIMCENSISGKLKHITTHFPLNDKKTKFSFTGKLNVSDNEIYVDC